jgi:hypothetical protein
MPKINSPWADSADCISPDGRYRAIISDAWEVGMGSPTFGTLVIHDVANGMRTIASIENCNPAFVWSSDSTALAATRWTRDRKQNLIVIAVSSGKVVAEAYGFRVLELHEFVGNVIKGVDSPIHMPSAFEFVLDETPGR